MSRARPETPAPTAPAGDLLEEAADWAMVLHYDAPSAARRDAFERWRALSADHEAAWTRARLVFDTFEQVPAEVGRKTLAAMGRKPGRRRSLKLLGVLGITAPLGVMAWRKTQHRWTADVITATGERRTLTLPDGSRLVLNTATAVDIAFTATQRRLRLHAGEILITTQPDPAPLHRVFTVETAHGLVRALGTRFGMRVLDGERCRVSVFEDAVEICPQAAVPRVLRAGAQCEFGHAHVGAPVPVDDSAALWEQGMLLAKNMRLGEVIAEMARHRPGILRCDPAVADVRVSGAISLADTDAGLGLLADTLALRVVRRTRYWVTLGPAS